MERTKLTGRIVTPDDKEYERARINNNLSISKFPSKIVFCQKTEDILNALRWAKENKVPFRLRSGRHSYENFSLITGGLVIDVSEMNKILINSKKMTAKIEAGANLGKVYNKLWKYGMTIPAGTESSVGIVGLTLGGGIGMLSRPFGLTSDNLIEIEMVSANGELIKANKSENSDLFWACCGGGGGGNFGIITSLTFRLHAISNVSIFSISWEWEDLEAAFRAWQDWAPHTDERLTSQIELKSKKANEIIAQGVFIGSSIKLKKLLRPLTTIGSPKNAWVKEVPYIRAVKFFDVPSGNQPALRKRSGSFIEKPLPPQAILMMKQFLANAPNSNSSIWHQSLGGAVGRVASDDSAYYYRKAITAQEYIATWENRDEEKQNISWIEALRKELSPYTAGDYVNFPDRYIKDWPKAYYGDNFRRLREVKTKYDPFNLFYFLQSIPPYKGWF
ncbi:FAD-binding oxidoreductase [Lederbergia lenta]|uniref:FAD-binding oxidoreductase n=4 Tax=Lederbergia lenta TaxID=1467 RepID=UPI002DBF3E9F|nr:FAD-binding oxidoreductase [Lederbergia lenta]MEC2326147.1 FAD-binding oxidoreductase [Lederbergia lenta]